MSKRSIRNSTDGVTLVELLLALTIGVFMLTVILTLTLANQRLYNVDEARTAVNQNLRSAMAIVGNDVRTAGERLSPRNGIGLAAVEVRGGTELVLRRNLLDETLPMCDAEILPGTSQDTVTVARTVSGGGVDLALYPQCQLVDDDGDGWSDALEVWKDLREAGNGKLSTFMFTATEGECFLYDAESQAPAHIEREDGIWTNGYDISENPTIVAFEEVIFNLNGQTLELTRGCGLAGAQRVVNSVNDFQVRAVLNDGTVLTDFVGIGAAWTTLSAIEISITGFVQQRGRQVQRTLKSRLFPRNVLAN